MKVLFSHSYFIKFDAKQLNAGMPYPPLGTLYAMAYIRQQGFDVRLFDTMFCDSASDIRSTIDSYKPDIYVSYDDCFNYLTKMCLTNMREACFDIQQYARSKGCYVITSSSDAADHFETYLKKGAHAIAIGEGEQTLFELCLAYRDQSAFTGIKGIAYLENNVPVKTPKREVIKDLDSLPPPAWDLLDISPYKKMWLDKHGYFSLNFVTTRGCPYKCNWCAKPIYGNRYNMHSAHHVVAEIKKWQSNFGFTHVWFCDDIFGLKPEWVIEFANFSEKENLHIKYKIQSRADLLVKENYVSALARSGCVEVWMGAESGSQKILDAMDKGITIDQIRQARSLLAKHNIRAAYFLQFGYPGENFEDIEKTLAFVKETKPDDIGVSVSYPLPGTPFYENVKHELSSKSNWTDSDDLALLFRNTYQPAFYKTLHRLIHSTYRKEKAINYLHSQKSVFTKFKPALRYFKYSLTGLAQYHQLKRQMLEKR